MRSCPRYQGHSGWRGLSSFWCMAPAYVQPEKLFTFFKLFQPSYFSVFKPFHPFKISMFLPFQLLYTFSFMFSWKTCSAIKLFIFLSSFSPLTVQLHCLNMQTLFHISGSKPPNYKRSNFLNGRCCMNKPRKQHVATCVDFEGPFIAACSFNFILFSFLFVFLYWQCLSSSLDKFPCLGLCLLFVMHNNNKKCDLKKKTALAGRY